MQNFFKKIVAAVDLHLDLEKLKCILIASPGFVREEFMEYIMAPKEENKRFTANRQKFVSVHSSSGYKLGIENFRVFRQIG